MRALLHHPRSLAAALLVAAAASLSCTDFLTGGRDGGIASIALAPHWTEKNAAIYRSLSDFDLQANSLRAVVVRPSSGDTIADTTVTISPTDTVVTLELKVELLSVQEILTAALEVRSGTVLLFSGEVQAVVRVGPYIDEPPVLIPLWVGPGSSATRVVITQADTTVRATASLPLSATAFDASNTPVTDPEFTSRLSWSVLEPTMGSIPKAGGAFTASGLRGTARVVVRTPNLLADTLSLSLVPSPTQISVISGASQTDTAGQELAVPFVVEVRAADNLPVPNEVVTFSVVSGGGSVAPVSALTNAQGRAQAMLRLGPAAGSQTFSASVAGVAPATVTNTAIVIQNDPATVAFPVRQVTVGTGQAASAVATVRTENGTVLADAAVTYTSRSTGIATVSSTGAITGVAKGQAVIVASVTNAPAIADSLLAVVTVPGGPVLITSLDRFRLPTDTQLTVSVFVDMRQAAGKLGSALIDLEWDPTQLTYVSHANGASGVSPTVNASNGSAGKLSLAMADVAGFDGRVEMLRVTFRTTTTPRSGTLALVAREINATDYSDLLPLTTQVVQPLRTP